MTPSQATLEWMRGRANSISDNVYSLGNRLSTWLIVGNAAAALFVMKATLDGSSCDPAVVKLSLVWFLWGLGLAFGGMVVTYFTSLASSFLMFEATNNVATVVQNEHYIQAIEAEFKVDVPDDSPLWVEIHKVGGELPKLLKKLRLLWWPTGGAMLLLLGAAICLGGGAIAPLVSPQFNSCLTNAQSQSLSSPGKSGLVTQSGREAGPVATAALTR